MFNPFILKKWIALLVVGTVPVIAYMMTSNVLLTIKNGLWISIGVVFACVFVFGLVASLLLKNPFTDLVEGKGIMTLDLNSTGIITPFIIKLNQGTPFIKGEIGRNTVNDVFDRECVMQLSKPINVAVPLKEDKETGVLTLTFSKEEYHRARMALYHYPVLIYNSQLGSLLTKEFLGHEERSTFIEHTILYISRKVEELNTNLLHFSRYVVESLKPKESMFSSWWVWIILGILVVVLLITVGPSILDALRGVGKDAVNTGSNIINPT